MVDHTFKRGHLGPAEQQEILTKVGSKILGKAPNDWERIIYTRSALIEVANSLVEIEFANGEKKRASPPSDIGIPLDELRAGMYIEGKGTWFSLEYVITRPGKFKVHYNYDDDPGITFGTAKGFTNDLKYFPRDPEHTPDWLNEKLQEEAGGEGTV
ncbi:immunity protein YezG family protein [Nocardiopsis lambiniae]|uniref:DUF600 family protein n=1 Tax=Nocardiopsis lambiniae TaxID=3075539 RepID=A0ABU2M3D8_9ACTN|nr:immunity protein YezG family protein [Nocardiopsis sp. DSM 44743]MDT0326816.1 DUF600 family protein [Nocardiopsis sp. DSM 44743]